VIEHSLRTSRLLRIALSVAGCLATSPSAHGLTPVAAEAIVSDIDATFEADQQGGYANFYDYLSGIAADRPWISIGANAGEQLDLELYSNFASTFWLYQVLHGPPKPGDTPFGPSPDLLLLANPDYPGTLYPRLWNFVTPANGYLLVQVDSYYGESGRFGFQLTRLPPVAEPASASLVVIGASLFAMMIWTGCVVRKGTKRGDSGSVKNWCMIAKPFLSW
jgi:hypothetical protein